MSRVILPYHGRVEIRHMFDQGCSKPFISRYVEVRYKLGKTTVYRYLKEGVNESNATFSGRVKFRNLMSSQKIDQIKEENAQLHSKIQTLKSRGHNSATIAEITGADLELVNSLWV